MLLKRYLVLAASVLLFIFIYVGYFSYGRSQMEEHFRQERAAFGADDIVLTDGTAAISPPATAAPAPAVDATAAAPDSNALIGPVPPSSTATPDAAAPSVPATPASDTNSAPMAPSTMDDPPRERHSSFFVLAAYHPDGTLLAQAPGVEPPRVSAALTAPNPAPAPAATSPAAPLSSATNTAPYAMSGGGAGAPRPAPVEASVIVLGYHQFMAPGESSKNIYKMRQDVFDSEMKYLHDNGYHVVPLSDVVHFIKHEIGLPPNSVAVTIDDGFKSAIVYAAPVLKKYGYPWTFFVYPAFITTAESKGAASWSDLLALQADGVDIECHSMTHPFPGLTHKMQAFKGPKHLLSPEEYDEFLTNETAGAKALLEQKMGKPIPYFAYPYGDYNKQVEARTVAAGYEGIFTVADNPVHETTSVASIGRYIITQPVEKNFAAYLRQGALGIAEADPAAGATISNPRPVITAVLGYVGNINPNEIETEVRDFGAVKHDYDPKTSTIRLYLPRDLVQPTVIINIRVKDADTGQVMVANWHFNYEPAGAAGTVHPPIAPPPAEASASTPSASTNVAPTPSLAPAPQLGPAPQAPTAPVPPKAKND